MSDLTDLIPIVNCDRSQRRGEVIFVHGLGGSARGTWHPQERNDDDNFWPAWLGEDLPDVGIWSLGYEVEPFKWKGNTMPLVDRATNTLALLDSYEIGVRPLVFVTHSLGGLLVKQMLRHAFDLGMPQWKAIVEQTQGIVFLSTPHSGSDLASWMRYIGGILGKSVSVEELEANHSRLRELNQVYRNHERLKQVRMEVYCETQKTRGFLVVNESSADPGIPGVVPIPMDCNHISIAKPESKNSLIYRRVKRFIEKNLATPLAPVLPKQDEPEASRQSSQSIKLTDELKVQLRDAIETVFSEDRLKSIFLENEEKFGKNFYNQIPGKNYRTRVVELIQELNNRNMIFLFVVAVRQDYPSFMQDL